VDGGFAVDALAAADFGDAAAEDGSGGDENAAVAGEGLDELGAPLGSLRGAGGGERLKEPGLDDGAFGKGVGWAGDADDDAVAGGRRQEWRGCGEGRGWCRGRLRPYGCWSGDGRRCRRGDDASVGVYRG